jgi:Family of unknown function (DUF6272)
MSFNIDDFYSQLNNSGVVLSFKGGITSSVINNILENIENKLAETKEDGKIRKKMYNVLVECLQNLYHHIEDLPQDLTDTGEAKFGVIVIIKNENGFKITTGNFVSSGRIKPLKDKIDKINSLSQDELKDMYKFILNHQKLTAKGGGGLGLVDIARKTGNKFEYGFHNISKDYYFFNLDIYVS